MFKWFWTVLSLGAPENHDIHYTKIHDYDVDYDIICAHHGGFKIQNFILGTKLPTLLA